MFLVVLALPVVSCNSAGILKFLDEAGRALADVSEAAGHLVGGAANATVFVADAAAATLAVASSALCYR